MEPVQAGYLTLFALVLLGEAGVPLLAPAELVLIGAGVAAANGLGSLTAAVAIALAADLLGTMALFAAVRRAARRSPTSRASRVVAWLTARATRLGGSRAQHVALGRCVPLLRIPATAGAALGGLTTSRFALSALVGGAVWVAVFLGGAFVAARGGLPW
ncbi:MAG: hypothetical protein ACR2NB_10530 [Solirubrobacteraceae bacterium]